jgi:SnoaL-like domain
MTDADEAAIRDLIARYALALDAGEPQECAGLFTPAGEFHVYGRTFTGRDAVAGMFRDAPRGLHLTGVSSVDVRDDAATARSQVLFVRAVDWNLRLALYDDHCVRDGGQWRFASRRCRFITTDGLSDHPQDRQP